MHALRLIPDSVLVAAIYHDAAVDMLAILLAPLYVLEWAWNEVAAWLDKGKNILELAWRTSQDIVLHPFLEVRRSVNNGDSFFFEYASSTFALLSAWTVLHSENESSAILELVMSIKEWATITFIVGAFQALSIPVGSKRTRAVACAFSVILWAPLALLYFRRAGMVQPIPGFLVFAIGNYFHLYALLRDDHGHTGQTR